MLLSKSRGTGAMTQRASLTATLGASMLPAVAGVLALAIFAIDTLSPVGAALAALYVAVVLLSVNFLRWRGVLLVSIGCIALAILGYLLQHGATITDSSFARLLVAVQDSGNGIDRENASRLFEAFFTTKPKGIGMGLSISRSIIDAHSGRIWFSEGDTGAIFQLALPAIRENAAT